MAADGRRGLSLAVAALALVGVLAPASGAEDDDIYTVRDVPVDATADNAAAARARALADGQRRALQRVYDRVTLEEDAKRLPRSNDRGIESLVQALEVDRERTSKVRYLASLTVRFKADEMRELLRQAGVRYAETRGKPVLLLPVYQEGDDAMLWDDANPWRRAWNAIPTGDGLISIIVPIGDLTDADTIDAKTALEGDSERLGAIAARYRAGEVVVAVAKLVENPDTKAQTLEITTARRGSALGEPAQLAPVAAPVPVDTPVAVEKLLMAAAQRLSRRVEDDWKRANLMSFGGEQQLLLSLPLGGIGDLVEARKRLSELPVVRRVDVMALTPRVARLAVTFSGGAPQLQAALAQKDMTLIPQPPDWTLTIAGKTAPAAPGAEAQPQRAQ